MSSGEQLRYRADESGPKLGDVGGAAMVPSGRPLSIVVEATAQEVAAPEATAPEATAQEVTASEATALRAVSALMPLPRPPLRPVVRAERAQVRQAIRRYFETRDTEARDEVVTAYQGLAYSLAGRFSQRGEELDDLNQVALIGLLKAVERFDPDRGAELTTFATATILGELKRHLRDRGWSIRLPRRIHDLHLQAQQSIDELTQEFGRSPTLAEIGARLDASPEDVVEALDAGGLRHSASLEAPLGPGEDHSLTNRLGSRDQRMAEVEGRLTLTPLLARLPERQQQILTLRFMVGYSQTEIASVVGVSQMQVSRLLARSLAQLRQWAAEPA